MGTPLYASAATVSYNGITIHNISRSKVRALPVYNNQGTAVKYVEYIVEIEAIVNPEFTDEGTVGQIDYDLEELRLKLLEPRQTFVYTDKGFGTDFSISSNFSKSDVTYGPRPNLLTFESLGGNKAARIVWVCTVRVPECVEDRKTGLCEFWCTSNVDINKSGYQTLTRRGYIEVMTQTSNNQLKNQLSKKFRPLIHSLLGVTSMQGFHLEQKYDFSPDDRSCNFTLTYTEIETDNPYPNGVVNIQCDHDMASKLLPGDKFQAGFKTWTNTMSCQVELRPNTPKLRAWAIFSSIASGRIIKGVIPEYEEINNRRVIVKFKVPIILSLHIHEDIFSHKTSFDITWVSHAKKLRDIFETSGMFKPVKGTDWDSWTADVRATVQHPGGAHPLLNLGVTTAIVSACNQTGEGTVPDTTRDLAIFASPAIFEPKCPPPEASWIKYQNKFVYSSTIGIVDHRRYAEQETINRIQPSGRGNNDQIVLDAGLNTRLATADFHRQDFGNDVVLVTLKGFALRLGRPTKPPVLTTIGGREVQIYNGENFVTDTVMDANAACPTFATTWEVTYEIMGYPEGDVTENKKSTDEINELS